MQDYMNGSNQLSSGRLFKIFGLLAVMMLTAFGGGAIAAASKPAPVVKQADSVLSKCRADLAKRLKLKEQDIKLADAQTIVWPNAALGMPEIGKVYAQVKTPGQKLFMQADNRLYLYVTSDKAFKYGGPLQTWAYSMLYLQSVPNDPNLNKDLYQCSLLGTNSIRLASEITDYYPQDKGSIIAKRRTSRSGHDLLYIDASQPEKETILYRAMDFEAAALKSDNKTWAACVRPRLGFEWTVAVGRIGEETSKAQVLPLPEGTRPTQIAWSDDTLMIVTKKDDSRTTYETSPNAESPTWKQVNWYNFPGQNRFMLNKSETLEISEAKENSKQAVEVARVWFTGDRNVVAKIPDLALQSYDLLGPYAFIWGEKDSRPAAYTVDISSGDSVVSFPGKGSDIKPFTYPPHNSPVPTAPRIE